MHTLDQPVLRRLLPPVSQVAKIIDLSPDRAENRGRVVPPDRFVFLLHNIVGQAPIPFLKNLRENKKCRDFLEKILKGTGKTVEDLIDAVTLQRPFNGAKSTISRLDAGLVNREVDIGTEPGRAYAKGSVDNSFKGSGAYEAWTAFYVGPDRSIGLTVSDRSDVYFKSVHSAGYGTILHEALHSLLKASDLDLGKLFDVAVVPNQDTNGITEAIKNGGCNKR